MLEGIALSVVLIFISCLFLIVGIKAFIDKKPFKFWVGNGIPSAMITDIKAYNKAYGIMWTLSAIPYVIFAIFSFIAPPFIVGTISGLYAVIDVFALMIISHRISVKYFVK